MLTAAAELPGFLAHVTAVLDQFGYLAVGTLIFIEDFGIPSPGETALVAGAVYAGTGRLSITGVVLIAVVAAVAGDSIGWLIGRRGGRRFVEKYGKYVFMTPRRLDAGERFFIKHGGKVVAGARFVEGLRQLNGIIAGLTGMPWRKFFLFNTLGSALWVGVWAAVGFLAGNHIDAVYHTVNRAFGYIVAGVVVALIAWWGLRRARRARQARSLKVAETTEVKAPEIATEVAA